MTLLTIRIEGGLLSPDFLDTIHEQPGQKPADFGLDARRSLVDEVTAVWSDVRAYWEAFERRRARARDGESLTSATREAWIIPLLEALGYRLTFQRRSAEADGRSYAISHRATDGGSREIASREVGGAGLLTTAYSLLPDSGPPVHIVAFDQKLGERPPAGRGTMAPHALVQDYLNRSDDTWGIVTNGATLRLLRDSVYFSRPSYVEFDLQGMLEGERLDEFILFYRLVHRSRLAAAGEDGSRCLLESYHQAAVEQGGRIRDGLRKAVEGAILTLANGFLGHPKNGELRAAIAGRGGVTPPLPASGYYQQLLYLIYRLLFLMVAEERNLLVGSREVGSREIGSGETAPTPYLPDTYSLYYSITRLRRLAEAPLSGPQRFDDLYLSLRTLFQVLRDETQAPALGVPALNGELFDVGRTRHLEAAYLNNRDLLSAIRQLSYFTPEKEQVRRRVNYAALDVEELGSVYESLLDEYPVITSPPTPLPRGEGSFRPKFAFVQGTERKTTGSYYTARELVKETLDSALDPVIREIVSREVGSGRKTNPVISGSGRVAEGDGSRRRVLPADEGLSQGRTVRHDLADAAGRDIGASQHRGGLRSGTSGGVRPLSADSPRLAQGTGNPPAPGGPRPANDRSLDSASPDAMRRSGKDAAQLDSKSAGSREIGSGEVGDDPTPYSPLTTSLLSIRVCDSACGSGHFLLAAARRIGRALAQVATGEDEPSPEAVRHWTREAIIHCIYGVDKNPLAVDLCKVALWIEGFSQGKPLTFLDAHIKCGDSLVGVFDLKVLDAGVPDEAFNPVTGDDKTVARELKRRNKREREGQLGLAFPEQQAALSEAVRQWQAQLDSPEDTPAQVRQKSAAYRKLQQQEDAQRTACDLWTAAFFMPLTAANITAGAIPTTAALWEYRRQPGAADPRLVAHTRALAMHNQFFHWPLEFPHVFAAGGFTVMLGNPPWERIKLQEQEFFAARDPEIAVAPTKAARQGLIDALKRTNPALAREFELAKHTAEAQSRFVRASGRFPLTAVGDVNTYALFAELVRNLLAPTGRAGILVPTGIATDDTTKRFFGDIVTRGALAQIIGFENEAFIFPAVHHSFRFCVLVMAGNQVRLSRADFVFFCRYYSQVDEAERHFQLSSDDVELINPNTRTMPVFRTRTDADLTTTIYRRTPVLADESTGADPWGLRFMTMFHMSNDSGLFENEAWPEHVPLYEAKMMHQFDHRYATYEGASEANLNAGILPQLSDEQKADPIATVSPRYWISASEVEARLKGWTHGWLLGFRDITSAIVERTAIFSLLPRAGVGNNAPLMLLNNGTTPLVACFLANLNSLACDYVTRQKIAGTHMNFFFVKQLPALPPSVYGLTDIAFINPRVLELVYTAWDMAPFAADLWADADEALRAKLEDQHQAWLQAAGGHAWNPPDWAGGDACPAPFAPAKWDEDRRAVLRAELDAYYARLYGLTRDELRYILDPKDVYGPDFPGETFRVLKEKEERAFGEYRTRRLVLEAWDRLEAELGPVVVRNYREEMRVGSREVGSRESRTAPARPARKVAEPRPAYQTADQPALLDDTPTPYSLLTTPYLPTPPQGNRSQRLSRLLTLGRQHTPEAIGELVAALGDEDEQLRWLAALSLQGIGGGTVIATLKAFIDQAPSAVPQGCYAIAREEAEKLLGKLTEPNR